MMTTDGSDLFGLYVHWPFCLKKCPYCDFNSHVRDAVDHDVWADALVRELQHVAARTDRAQLTSIFFGGGTPSLMDPKTVAAVINEADRLFSLSDEVEITLEANPTSADQSRFHGYRAAGVNRVSLGVQSLRDDALQFLGRQHSVAEAMAALDMGQAIFDRVSFDLIYARAGQSLADWEQELGEALSRGTDHLSLYQLTIEPETEFGKRFAMGQLPVMDDDPAADMYALTQTMTGAAGMPAYETSNHALESKPGESKKGTENQARHNLTYWQGAPYIGIGPGAHGRVMVNGQKVETVCARTPEDWLRKVDADGHGYINWDAMDDQSISEEVLMMGLRLTDGVPLAKIAALPAQVIDDARLAQLIDGGFIARTDTHMYVTDQGRPVLNAILAHLLS